MRTVSGAKSIVDVDIAQFRQRLAELLHIISVRFDLREKESKALFTMRPQTSNVVLLGHHNS